jgi:hypothetical protein
MLAEEGLAAIGTFPGDLEITVGWKGLGRRHEWQSWLHCLRIVRFFASNRPAPLLVKKQRETIVPAPR